MIALIPDLFPIAHGMIAAGFVTAFILGAARRRKAAQAVFLAGQILLTAQLAMIVLASRRPPLYGMFESVTAILWTAGVCFSISAFTKTNPPSATLSELPVCCGVMAFLSGLMFFWPIRLNPDFFMYADPWVQDFFVFSLVSAGVMLYAGIAFAAAAIDGVESFSERNQIKDGNLLFLIGTLFFLASEFSGAVWCLRGWGDSWRWSGNFFQSTAIFFLLLLNLHIPSNLFGRAQARNIFGAVSCAGIFFLFLH